MKRLLFPALALLAACGTPQERCIATATRDLRTVEKLIAEAEGNLSRGYAIETVTVWESVWDWCYPPPLPAKEGEPPPPPPKPQLCEKEVSRTIDRPKSIDLDLEAKKLAQLKDKRRALTRAAEPAIAQCRAQYPE